MTLPTPVEAEETAAVRAVAARAAAGAETPLRTAGLLADDLPMDVALAVAEECGRAGLVELPAEGLPRAAAALGSAAHLLDAGTRYARDRQVFGRPLATFQVQRHAFARAASDLAAARALVWRAATYADRLDVATAEVVAMDAAWRAAETVLQIHGGNGYSEGDVSARWRVIAGERAAALARANAARQG